MCLPCEALSPLPASPRASATSTGPPIQALAFGSLLHKAPSTSDHPFLLFSFLPLQPSNPVPIPDLCPWVISLAFLGAAHSVYSRQNPSPLHLALRLVPAVFPSR